MNPKSSLEEERAYEAMGRDGLDVPQHASFVRRMLAFVIDWAVVGVYCSVLMGAMLAVETAYPTMSRWAFPVIFVPPMWLGFGLYFILMEASPLQGTLGKFALGLRIVGPDGGRICWIRSSIRLLLWLASAY